MRAGCPKLGHTTLGYCLQWENNLPTHTIENALSIQGDQLHVAVRFWYLVNSDLTSVRYYVRVKWTSLFFQSTRTTRPCLTGHPLVCPKNYDKNNYTFSKKYLKMYCIYIYIYCI